MMKVTRHRQVMTAITMIAMMNLTHLADDGDDSKQDTATGDSGDVEDTAANEEETEVDLVQMNPLLEQIRESVSRALSATGTDDQ